MSQKPSLKAWGLLILLSLIWGSSFILIKKGLLGLGATEVGALRIFTACIVMLPVAILKWKNVKKRHIPYLIAVGFSGSLIPAFLFAIAQTRTPSAVTGVINALTPLFTLLIGVLIYRQKTNANVLIGIIIGFAGTLLLVMAGSRSLSNFNYYALLIVLATVLYATNLNIIKYHLQELKSLTITSISLLFVGPISGGYLFFFTDFFNQISSHEVQVAAAYIVVLGIMGTAIALIIFNKLVQLTEPVFTSSVTYIIPLVAIVWGLFDGEQLSMYQWLGMALILLGVYLANRISTWGKKKG